MIGALIWGLINTIGYANYFRSIHEYGVPSFLTWLPDVLIPLIIFIFCSFVMRFLGIVFEEFEDIYILMDTRIKSAVSQLSSKINDLKKEKSILIGRINELEERLEKLSKKKK